MGRPTKLDDLVSKRILDAVRAGVSRRGAAQAAGIDYSTLKNWISAGRRGDETYRPFLTRLDEAEYRAEREMVDVLFSAAKDGKWQAAESWLKSRRMLDYAAKQPDPELDGADEEEGDEDLAVARSVLAALESRKVG